MYTEETTVARPVDQGRDRRAAVLPPARRVLAVVTRPGEESGYLGAVLDAFHTAGAAVNVLALTSGEPAPECDSAHLLDLVRSLEFELATSALGVERRLVVDRPDTALPRLSAGDLAGDVRRAARDCDADLLVVAVDGSAAERAVPRAVACAGRGCATPVLAWTLPADVARSVRRASGLAVLGEPYARIDVEIRIRRSIQRRAMRAYRSRLGGDRAQLARLAIQGDREWLRWLVPVR